MASNGMRNGERTTYRCLKTAKVHQANHLILREKISFSKYKNKRFILNFFASWCLPCKIEAPLLNKVSSKIPIIGIAYKDKEEDMIKFLKNYGNPFNEIGVDELGSIAIEWGVYGVPETFLIDENGKIIYKYAGAISHELYKDKIIPFINNN